MSFAEKYRPRLLDDVVGQDHLLCKGGPLRVYAENAVEASAIFYGPPGTGKTTVARILAEGQGRPVVRLNATSAGSKELKDASDQAAKSPNGILLYLDEVQYLNKKQQQLLLPDMESGKIRLIGSTTENPYFYVYGALLSRSMVFEFKPVPPMAIVKALRAAAIGEGTDVAQDAAERIAELASGDVRRALSLLEMACGIVRAQGRLVVGLMDVIATGQAAAQRYDRVGDETYDLASALMKSIRGSDPDAALYYLARFLVAGDLMTPIRRILCSASEDVGLAWPLAAPIAKALCDSALQLGLPEAKLPLGQAVIILAMAPKSNASHDAVIAAMDLVEKGGAYPPPRNLQNVHCPTGDPFDRDKDEQGYLYPHGFAGHWVPQQYLPDQLLSTRFYIPGDCPAEQSSVQYWENLKQNWRPPT